MSDLCILVHMRTTLIIDESLVQRASELTGTRRKTALVRAGLEALIAREAARRLAALASTEPGLRALPRRRGAATR
jgi:Arc/MetJ family transcription regulator